MFEMTLFCFRNKFKDRKTVLNCCCCLHRGLQLSLRSQEENPLYEQACTRPGASASVSCFVLNTFDSLRSRTFQNLSWRLSSSNLSVLTQTLTMPESEAKHLGFLFQFSHQILLRESTKVRQLDIAESQPLGKCSLVSQHSIFSGLCFAIICQDCTADKIVSKYKIRGSFWQGEG